jgi:hypothetical protein
VNLPPIVAPRHVSYLFTDDRSCRRTFRLLLGAISAARRQQDGGTTDDEGEHYGARA